MKHAEVALIAAIVVLVASLFSPSAQAGVSFSAFYSDLSPYGSWQVSAQYGRVWQPSVYASGWNPYYDGHWVYSDLGWTWVSDYEWGAIPYHYGTWVSDPYNGWVWVPGYTWAPSWVVFRTGPDYIGWAPVSPGFSIGVSVGFGVPTASPFVFVSAGNFLAPRIRTCFVPQSRTTVIINNTRIVNNLRVENSVVVNRGPDPRIIERASGRRVREVPIERVSRVMPGPRVSRADLSVNPEQARHGVRAAEPVSVKRPLPNPHQGQGEIEKYRRGARATKESASLDAPHAPRRVTGDIERLRGVQAPTESIPVNSPRAPRRVTDGNGMTRQESSQKADRVSPSARYRARRAPGSETMGAGRLSPRETRSIQQPTRQNPPNRQPGSAYQEPSRKEAPSRAKATEHKQEKKSRESGKD